MAANNGLVLGKLRFDTSALDSQLTDITKQLNALKTISAEAKKVASGSSGVKVLDVNRDAVRAVNDEYRKLIQAQKDYKAA